MRTILFKGKTLNYDPMTMPKWAEGWYCQELHQGQMHHLITDGALTFEVDPDTISQFTGKYDKDGLPIYEGDIFGFEDDPTVEYVKWSEEKAMFAYSSVEPRYTYEMELGRRLMPCMRWVRLGNRYDNPELMNYRAHPEEYED